MSRSAYQDTERVLARDAGHIEALNLSAFLEQYRPMLKLLSHADLVCLKRRGYSKMGYFRRERARIYGSEQEFDKRPISRGVPENHEFGFGDGHALRLEQEV